MTDQEIKEELKSRARLLFPLNSTNALYRDSYTDEVVDIHRFSHDGSIVFRDISNPHRDIVYNSARNKWGGDFYFDRQRSEQMLIYLRSIMVLDDLANV